MNPTITDESVEAARKRLWPAPDATFIAPSREDIRAALEAALPHLSRIPNFDTRPSIGATTPEPCLREIVHGYYRQTFSAAVSQDLTRKYLSALSSPAPEAATAEDEMIAAQAKSFAENDAANRGPRDTVSEQPDQTIGEALEIIHNRDQSTPDVAEELEMVAWACRADIEKYLDEAGKDISLSKVKMPEYGMEMGLADHAKAKAIIEKLRAENERLTHEVESAGALRLRMEGHKEARRATKARLAGAVEALNHAADNLDFAGFSVSADLARQAALQALGKEVDDDKA